MYKIKEFSTLSKLSIKTLRYYEKEQLLKPAFVDKNSYRYYETKQLLDIAKIVSLRQIGFSIKDIKIYLKSNNKKEMLQDRKMELEKALIEDNIKLSKTKYLLEDNTMKYEVIIKKLPDYTVYYMEGIVKKNDEISAFILKSADECLKINPNIKCIEPDYCYLNYLYGEYKESNIKIRYNQAVEKEGISNSLIKFMKLIPSDAVCIYHKGSYEGLREAYAFIMNYIEENNYEIIDSPRERYIDGIWNKDNKEDWLTEIQVPVIKK